MMSNLYWWTVFVMCLCCIHTQVPGLQPGLHNRCTVNTGMSILSVMSVIGVVIYWEWTVPLSLLLISVSSCRSSSTHGLTLPLSERFSFDLLSSFFWEFLMIKPIITHKAATNTGVREENNAMIKVSRLEEFDSWVWMIGEGLMAAVNV